jgi:hypothetical protein
MQSRPPHPETLHTTSRGCKWEHKQCHLPHPAPLLKTICTIKTSRHIPGLPHISDEHRQNIRRWHNFGIHKGGHQHIQGRDILITCKGEPILIGIQDNQGQYQIPLMQQQGRWQPRHPSKQAQKALQQANSVYNLPSTKQAIKWMHAVCGYPVKLTWLKAIKAGNYVG